MSSSRLIQTLAPLLKGLLQIIELIRPTILLGLSLVRLLELLVEAVLTTIETILVLLQSRPKIIKLLFQTLSRLSRT